MRRPDQVIRAFLSAVRDGCGADLVSVFVPTWPGLDHSGPVIFQVAGVGQATPITITGQGLVNTSFKPSDLQFIYGGTGQVKLAGGDQTSALFYTPNAAGQITGGADLYGAIVVKTLSETGGAAIHYDRNLQRSSMTAGNYMLSAFTWKNY